MLLFLTYLVLLPLLSLLFYLLLFLQLLCDPGLAQSLPLAALVGLGIESRLQCRITAHARSHLTSQL